MKTSALPWQQLIACCFLASCREGKLMFSPADNEQTTPVDTEHIAGEILRLRNQINISKSNSAQNPANTRPTR